MYYRYIIKELVMVDSKIGPVVKVTEILNEISEELANLKTAGFLKINIKDRPPKN